MMFDGTGRPLESRDGRKRKRWVINWQVCASRLGIPLDCVTRQLLTRPSTLTRYVSSRSPPRCDARSSRGKSDQRNLPRIWIGRVTASASPSPLPSPAPPPPVPSPSPPAPCPGPTRSEAPLFEALPKAGRGAATIGGGCRSGGKTGANTALASLRRLAGDASSLAREVCAFSACGCDTVGDMG